MSNSVKDLWSRHFQSLEVKTNDNSTLQKVLDQIIILLDNGKIKAEEVKGATWASIAEDNKRSFGMMILFENKLEFIGAVQGQGTLQIWEWPFNILNIEKVEDLKLGITREIHLIYNNKKIICNGMKGFVPSLFILTLEKFWFKP